MIKQELEIQKYNWRLVVIYKANEDLSEVANCLWELQCPANQALQAIRLIRKINTGFCYTNNQLKSSLICISHTDSDEELINTITHEVKHLQSHICSYYGISEKGEEAAYLVGDTIEELYKIFKYELGKS